MDNLQKLYMIMLGCKPEGRMTEQHDVFFGIGDSLKSLIPQMNAFWPEAKGKLHIDAWREVSTVGNHKIQVIPKDSELASLQKLFFINLGGYKPNEFDEFHYKVLATGETLSEATKKSKTTAFFKHYGFKGATSHIDEKYGVDIDDQYNVADILSDDLKSRFQLKISESETILEDEIHLGYFRFEKL